jgi:Family of unknown function (DUF6164)
MAFLFFRLNGVPQDEADDIRQLLDNHQIDYYETDGGNWGMSMPAIWLHTEEDMEKIQPLYDEYQRDRTESQRELYQQQKYQNRHKGFFNRHKQHPFRLLFYVGIIVLVAYCSIKWVFEMGLEL